MAAGDTSITVRDLTKTFGEQTAVSELTFEVSAGAVFGFLGPNGAGKTTTIRLLTALQRPTTGHATVGGVSIEDRGALTERIGYLPEDPPVYDEFTGQEQLKYAAGLRQLDSATVGTRIDELLERFELDAARGTRISEYSRGMRQKLGIIQAVLHEPAVVFLDEPTRGLDPRASRVMRELIDELAAAGTTVFLSTHLIPLVETVATEVGIIDQGELKVAGELPAMLEDASGKENATLEQAFLRLTASAADTTGS